MASALLLALLLSAPVPETPIVVVARGSGTPVPDAVLATMRGGLRLPNGLDVSIGIDIQTRIDGVLALHSIYMSEGPNAGLRVYTDGTDTPRGAPGTTPIVAAGQTAAPTVIVARAPSGPVITPGVSTPAVAVNLLAGTPDTWPNSDGQMQLPVRVDGPVVQAPAGTVALTSAESGAVVTLEAPMLRVQQLIGQATGVVVANTASNRTIDNVSSINVDLDGLTPATMAAIFAVQRAATDAVRGR